MNEISGKKYRKKLRILTSSPGNWLRQNKMASVCPLHFIMLWSFIVRCGIFATRPFDQTKLPRGTNYVFRENEVGRIRFGLILTDSRDKRPFPPNPATPTDGDVVNDIIDIIISNTTGRRTNEDLCTCCHSWANQELQVEDTVVRLSHWLSGTQCQVALPRQVRGRCDVTETRSMTKAVAVTCAMTRRMTAKDNGRWFLYGAAQNRTFTVLVLKEAGMAQRTTGQTVSKTRVSDTSLLVPLSCALPLPVVTRELPARMAVEGKTHNQQTADSALYVSVAVILSVFITLLFILWHVKRNR